jgi:hypothetical protein
VEEKIDKQNHRAENELKVAVPLESTERGVSFTMPVNIQNDGE